MNFPELKTLPTQEEIDALRAQVELLNKLIVSMQERACLFLQPDGESEGNFVNFIMYQLDGPEQRIAQSTPAQCLAEIKARAIEDAADHAAGLISDRHGIANSGAALEILNHKTDVVLCVAEYANQLRQAAKDAK